MAAPTPECDVDVARAAADNVENSDGDYGTGEWETDIVGRSGGVLPFGGDGSCDASAVLGRSMGRLVRDVRRDERNDMRNRFLSIDMDAQVSRKLVLSRLLYSEHRQTLCTSTAPRATRRCCCTCCRQDRCRCVCSFDGLGVARTTIRPQLSL